MTPGYAFTDYKAQGQTIEYLIVDIGKPPTGHLSPFGAYVAIEEQGKRKYQIAEAIQSTQAGDGGTSGTEQLEQKEME